MNALKPRERGDIENKIILNPKVSKKPPSLLVCIKQEYPMKTPLETSRGPWVGGGELNPLFQSQFFKEKVFKNFFRGGYYFLGVIYLGMVVVPSFKIVMNLTRT